MHTSWSNRQTFRYDKARGEIDNHRIGRVDNILIKKQ